MPTDRFDDLARTLAQGASRRTVIKSLVAGIGIGMFARRSLPARSVSVYAEGPGSVFLPFVAGAGINMCPVASVCPTKHYCSDRQDCICIKNAEGYIACGQTPACSAPLCTTSADCAHLGVGYFCDTPNSGCCDPADSLKQRCVAPCKNPATCSPEHICAGFCCEDGENCINGKCIDAFNGTWTGNVTYEGQSAGIRFIIQRTANRLDGRMLMQDPVTQQYLESGAILGARSAQDGFWYTEGQSSVRGSFAGNTLTGTMTFPPRNGEASFTADVLLQRPAQQGAQGLN